MPQEFFPKKNKTLPSDCSKKILSTQKCPSLFSDLLEPFETATISFLEHELMGKFEITILKTFYSDPKKPPYALTRRLPAGRAGKPSILARKCAPDLFVIPFFLRWLARAVSYLTS